MAKKKDKQPEEIKMLDRAHEASKIYLDGMPYRLETVLDRMYGDVAGIQHNFIDMGMCALGIKHVHGHGQFMEIIKKRFEDPGICTGRTIRNAMAVAQFVVDNPKLEKFSNLKELGKYKQLMLAGASSEDIDEEEGTVFGLTMDEIKATKIKDLERKIKKKDQELDEKDSELNKGAKQLTEAREKLDKEVNHYKYVGVNEETAERVLDDLFNMVHSVMVRIYDQADPGRMSPRLQAKTRCWAQAVTSFVEEMSTGITLKLDKEHRDPGAWKPPYERDPMEEFNEVTKKKNRQDAKTTKGK